jgi:RNA polymerase sigma-32 factor
MSSIFMSATPDGAIRMSPPAPTRQGRTQAQPPRLAQWAEDQGLCQRWHDHYDVSAAARLAMIYRPLIVDIASLYQTDDRRSEELVAEGQLGLMQAICRFDPGVQTGFATFAARHIRMAIGTYVMRHAAQGDAADD